MRVTTNYWSSSTLFVLLALLLPLGSMSAQICGTANSSSSSSPSMPTTGTLRALVVLIDYPDDPDQANNIWPLVDGNGLPIAVGPTWKNSIIDASTSNPSNTRNNITTYFNRMSGGSLNVIGDVHYQQARFSLATYQSNPTFSSNIPYWTVRHVLEDLDPIVNYSSYDNWTGSTAGSDGKVDMIFAIFRNKEAGNGFSGWNGIASFNDGSSFILDGTTINASAPWFGGSGLMVQNGIEGEEYLGITTYPKMMVIVHEFGHFLGLDHQYAGGVWACMSAHDYSPSYLMNSKERAQLGWMSSIVDVTSDGQTETLSDFATNRVACRLALPNNGGYYWIENHQGVAMYDVVDNSGNPPGIYVLFEGYVPEASEGNLEVITADGRWVFNNPSSTTAAWGNQTQVIPVFQRGNVQRYNGLTDREPQPYTTPGPASTDFMFAWINDEWGTLVKSGGLTGVEARYEGDGRDKWELTYNNMFSPWSNPSSRRSSTETSTVGFQITDETALGNSTSTFDLKFYTSTPLSGPPSKPQNLHAIYYAYGPNPCGPPDVCGISPKLTWTANIESDVTSNGSYEIWRTQNGTSFTHLATVSGTTTEYIDYSINDANQYGNDGAEYEIRAVDSQDLLSVFSDFAGAHYGISTLKTRSQPSGATMSLVLEQNAPNPVTASTTISFATPDDGSVSLVVLDPLGHRVATLAKGFMQGGEYSAVFDAQHLPSGVYLVILQHSGQQVVRKMVVGR
jgi:M6 family metalloprotease-like protein